MFIVVEWENTSESVAKHMILDIEEANIGIVGANVGEMICYSDHENYQPVEEILTNIVHKHNHGAWCKVEVVTEESIQHLL